MRRAEILDTGHPIRRSGRRFPASTTPPPTSAGTASRTGAPELLGRFVYGIPELHREAIAGAQAVAAAGCYPTAAILALKPLLGLIDPGTINVDAASGVSGAGKALKEASHFNTVDENFTAYGLLSHRHTAEMEMELGGTHPVHAASRADEPRHPRHLHARSRRGPATRSRRLREAYADEPFIHVSERPPSTKWTLGSNAVHLTARYDERTGRVLAIAALDNLVKGAAGQMIQCANLMLGLDETRRPCRVSESGHERHRRLGLRRRRLPCRDQAAAATTWRWSRPTIGKPVDRGRASSPSNKFVAPPVMLDRARLADEWRQGGGDHRQFGQRQCRHRRAPAWPTPRR